MDGKDQKIETMCDWKKDRITENLEAFRQMVMNPGYACRNCGRVAVEKKRLCKPVPLL